MFIKWTIGLIAVSVLLWALFIDGNSPSVRQSKTDKQDETVDIHHEEHHPAEAPKNVPQPSVSGIDSDSWLKEKYTYSLWKYAEELNPQIGQQCFSQIVGDEENIIANRKASDLIYLYQNNKSHLKSALDWYQELDETGRKVWFEIFGQGVLDAIQNGYISAYRDRHDHLSEGDLELAKEYPGAFPYLLASNSELVRKVIRFDPANAIKAMALVLDTKQNKDGLERFAWGLNRYGSDTVMSIIEQYGQHVALLLSKAPGEYGEALPEFFYRVAQKVGYEDAFILTIRYPSRIRAADKNGKLSLMIERSAEFINRLREFPSDRRDYYLDREYILDLACESLQGGDRWGLELLLTAGPAPADIVYRISNHDPFLDRPKYTELSSADSLVLKGIGYILEQGADHQLMLYRLAEEGGQGDLHKLLNHPGSGIVGNRTGTYLIAITQPWLGLQGIELAEAVNEEANRPIRHIIEDLEPEPAEKKYLEWIPGYVALSTVADIFDGRDVSGLQMAFAAVDGAFAVGGLSAITGKVIARVGARATSKTIGKGSESVVRKNIKRVDGHLKNKADEVLNSWTKGHWSDTMKVIQKVPSFLGDSISQIFPKSGSLDITKVGQFLQRIGKKMGIKTRGRLDPRILNRSDRQLRIDLNLQNGVREGVYIATDELQSNAAIEFCLGLMERAVQ